MRLSPVSCQSISIAPLLDKEQVIAVVNRYVIVVLDIPVFSSTGFINALGIDHLQEFFPHIWLTFVCYVQDYHLIPSIDSTSLP